MNVFLLSLISPALWAASNHFNKLILNRFMPGARVGAIVIFAASVGCVTLPVSFFLQREAFQLGAFQALLIVLNGGLYICALIPFLKALKISDASTAIPILQMIPVFSFILARIFLGEVLSAQQLLGGLAVILGALIISLKSCSPGGAKALGIRVDVLGLMLLCSLIYATSFLLFKVFALKVEFWSAVFWESVGFLLFAGAALVFSREYRDDFLLIFPRDRLATTLAMTNELINIIAKIVFNNVSLYVPITLAWIGVSFQPVFVLLYSIVLARFFPRVSNEDVSGVALYQKVSAIVLMVIGAVVMNG
jgi:drug/metabolite transporter (DMT)-like permease